MEKHNCGGLYFHVSSEEVEVAGGIYMPRPEELPAKVFPPDHPAADLLRYKQFLADVTKVAELAESRQLLPALVKLFRGMKPLVRFLNEPLTGQLRNRAVDLAD